MGYEHLVDNLRRSLPPEPEIESPLDRVREFSQWLLIVPVLIAIIFGCGQIALFTTSTTAFANTRSSLEADYVSWAYLEVPAVRPEIVDEIKADQDSDSDAPQKFSDPVEVPVVWVDETSPTDTGGDVAMGPTEVPGGESGPPTSEPGNPIPTTTESGEIAPPTLPATQPPGSTNPPSPTQVPGQTSSPGPTATPYPTSTPGPSSTSVTDATSTSSPNSTATTAPSTTPTVASTATNPPTNTPTPNPTSTSPPVNYCANISWGGTNVEDWQNMGTVIKFNFTFENNNNIPMSLTSYTISWTDSGLSLHRTKAILGDGTRPKIVNSSGSSPRSCTGCPVTFVAHPSVEQDIYNMYCKDTVCNEDANDPPIPSGSYNFNATGTFTFYGSSTVNCNFNKSGSITMH